MVLCGERSSLPTSMTTPKPDAIATTSKDTQTQISLNKQIILDEDEYTKGLSHIIKRDFFPGLAHLDAQNAYLTALNTHDPTEIQSSVRKLEELGPTPRLLPGQTPYLQLQTPREDEGARPRAKKRKLEEAFDMSLDEFQARYTSEDNASFTDILDDENIKRKERYSWAWDAQQRVIGWKERETKERERLLLGNSDQTSRPGVIGRFAIERPPDPLLITESGERKDGEEGAQTSSVALVPVKEGDTEIGDVMAKKKDTRAAGVPGWNFKVGMILRWVGFD